MAETDDVAAAEAARAQAEARRKRIMERANKRMNLVSGEGALADEDKDASKSNAARIRAARNRRYRNRKAASNDEQTQPDATSGAATTTTATTTTTTRATTTEDSVKTAGTATAAKETTAEPEARVSAKSSTGAAPTDDDAAAADKKKYLGVAKMRRKKMLAKKKSKSDVAPEVTEDQAKTISQYNQTNPLPKAHQTAIYMHILTVFLLLFAGIDVGVQVYRDDITIHTQNAASQHGVPILHRDLFADKQSKGAAQDALDAADHVGDAIVPPSDEDEFGVDDDEDQGPNIDPLFGVDLDDLTKEPTLLNTIAKAAIWLHRLNLRIFYYMPINFFLTLMSLPQALMDTPPILCGVALILRQLVGNVILGAEIPASEDGEKKKKKDTGIDPVAMVKSGVTNFMSSTFPTLVAMYSAFTHLRSDMYVVICGVFIGVLYTNLAESSIAFGTTSDEL